MGEQARAAGHFGELLQLIRAPQGSTRAQLIRETGLSRTTVNYRLDTLIDAGYVTVTGQQSRTGGRPAEVFRVNPRAGYLLLADIGGSHTMVALADLGGTLLAAREDDLDPAEGPAPVVRYVSRMFDELLAEVGAPVERVLGLGIGVPAPVEVGTGRVVKPRGLPSWDGVVVPDLFAGRYPGFITVDKDANAMALGEYRAARRRDAVMVLVKIGMGIGMGIVAHGRLLVGDQGAAGDIGHMPRGTGVTCRCGQIGCVEATAGGRYISHRLAELGVDVHTSAEIDALVRSGNSDAVRLVRETGRRVAEVVADTVSLLNPSRIVLGGGLVGESDDLLASVREVVYRTSHPLATANLRIEPSVLGGTAGLWGAAELALDKVLAPDVVDRNIATGVRLVPTPTAGGRPVGAREPQNRGG